MFLISFRTLCRQQMFARPRKHEQYVCPGLHNTAFHFFRRETAGADHSPPRNMSRHSSLSVPMVTVSLEVFFKDQQRAFLSTRSRHQILKNFFFSIFSYFLESHLDSKMVVLQKSENQVYTDIVRSLKQNFRSETQPPQQTQSERKVRIRTNCHYRSELTEDHWKEKYNRRVKQSVGGFYTPAHVPYASVGDLCLDVRDLVVKTVGFEQSQSEKVIH